MKVVNFCPSGKWLSSRKIPAYKLWPIVMLYLVWFADRFFKLLTSIYRRSESRLVFRFSAGHQNKLGAVAQTDYIGGFVCLQRRLVISCRLKALIAVVLFIVSFLSSSWVLTVSSFYFFRVEDTDCSWSTSFWVKDHPVRLTQKTTEVETKANKSTQK